MDLLLFFVISSLFSSSLLILKLEAAKTGHSQQPAKAYSDITVMGLVYCDICSNNSFSRHSYYLSGAEVKIDCTFKAVTPRTTEQISVSVNRTTNRSGIYKLEIPSVDGIRCAEDAALISSCKASLMWSSSPSCNVPGYRTTSDEISVKSRQANICIYSLNPLNFRPSKRDNALCQN